MTDLVLITLIPKEPRDAVDWNNDLQGLKISVFELTIADSQSGLPLGIADKVQSFPIQDEIAIIDGELGRNILQHFALIWPPWPILPVEALPYSVATAVVKVNLPSPHPEFPSPKSYDLRIVVERDGQALEKDILEYNITVFSPPALSTLPETYSTAVANDPILRSAFIKIPPKPKVTLNPGVKYSADGQTPIFDDLVISINAVLSKDTTSSLPNEETSLQKRPKPLTPKQCRQVAWELVYDRGKIPLPLPKHKTLEQMFTGKDKAEADDQDRKKFEGDLTGYHAVHDAEARSLVTYIYAASAAIECERLSWQAFQAAWTFPILDSQMPAEDVYPTLSVILNAPKLPAVPVRKLEPSLVVPAAFFYVLGSIMPPELPPADRYRSAILNGEISTLRALETALDNGVLKHTETTLTVEAAASRSVNIYQASRSLWSLGHASGSLPSIDLTPPVSELVQDWLAFLSPNDNLAEFWFTLLSTPAKAQIYLELLLQIVTAERADLKTAIKTDLSVATAHDLFIISDKSWRQFFLTPAPPAINRSALLPTYTEPGDSRQRTEAFIARLNKLFDVKVDNSSAIQHNSSSVTTLQESHQDALGAFFQTYGPLDFSEPLENDAIETALEAAFANDRGLKAWVKNAVTTIHFLTIITTDIPSPTLQFSCMEALYCRGFSTADRVAFLSATQFQNALAGTVAYPSSIATPIYEKAGSLSTGYQDEGPEPSNGFTPVNPGNLVDCVPAENLSPFCSVEYAHQLLQSPVQVKGEKNDASLEMANTTVADILQTRRGDISSLQASWQNYDTQIPAIDLVLESLEYLGNQFQDSHGKVYDTKISPFADLELVSKDLVSRSLFRAKPENSTPAVPVASPQVYSILSEDFSSPRLPYSQALDINRTYLQRLGLRRFDVMRTFRSAITEFVVAPSPEPEGFQSELWRLPVRLDVAIEYLSISPNENNHLFTRALTSDQLMNMYASSRSDEGWQNDILTLPVLLKGLGLSYCEFKDLRQSGFIEIRRQSGDVAEDFPACEPCCGTKIRLYFGTGEVLRTVSALAKLTVFVRLWRLTQSRYGKCFSMGLLATICNRLRLFLTDDDDGLAVLNPDFLRQFIALLMLKDFFDIPLQEEVTLLPATMKTMWLLDVWTTEPDSPDFRHSANKFLLCIERHAKTKPKHAHRRTEAQWLDLKDAKRLAHLVGFPDSNSWYANPTSTLRFAEVLVKIYQSKFSIGELLFIFTNGKHITGDDPFPQEEHSESVVDPLNVPEDDLEAGLWSLRAKLLAINSDSLDAQETCRWTWSHIEGTLSDEFGFESSQQARDTLHSIGTHFFPSVLEAEGRTVTNTEKQFRVKLPNNATSAAIWNCPPYHPFHYDPAVEELWIQVPVHDEGVLQKLASVRQLKPLEQTVVRNLYFMPRALLAPFACIFPKFEEAVEYLCQEESEADRWACFQHAFAVFYTRCHVIAQHLSMAVCGLTSHDGCGGNGCCDEKASWLVLKSLIADENRPYSPWERKTGEAPGPLNFRWDPFFSGTAFSAILGLVGTGLRGVYAANDTTRWHNITSSLSFFGCARDRLGIPIPTILPELGVLPTAAEQKFVVFKNGFALEDATARNLGGAEGFKVTWTGVLLIEEKGDYHFKAFQPCRRTRAHGTCDLNEACDDACECQDGVTWSLSVKRGPKHWTLKATGTGKKDCSHDALHACLTRGVYDIVIKFVQCPSHFLLEDNIGPVHTGFVVTYSGPDTCNSATPIPAEKLFIKSKEEPLTISKGNPDAQNTFLGRYFSTLRDIRRTYQRAFKAILFSHKFCLSAEQNDFCDGESELGLLLRNPFDFVGTSYYLDHNKEILWWTFHRASFDFNFLPVDDEYVQVKQEVDNRAEPSDQRMTALFDWWERIFDYCQLREEVEGLVRTKCSNGHLWTMFHKAAILQGTDEDSERAKALVRYLGVDMSLAPQVTCYFLNTLITEKRLRDERWAVRVWHAKKMLDAIKISISTSSLEHTRPDLWASDDPNSENFTEPPLSGNKNLTLFVEKSSLNDSPISRLADIQKLNDGLRIRAREALLEYLCRRERVKLPLSFDRRWVESPSDLSAMLLQDVNITLCHSTTRIDDAVSSIHTLIQRICLGLEPSLTLEAAPRKAWDEIFSSFDKWVCWQRRRTYLEDWVEWKELHEARKSEAFPFFENSLRRQDFNKPESTPPFFWTRDQGPTSHLLPIQSRDLAIQSAQRNSPDEGLTLMAAPSKHARQTMLARVNIPSATKVPEPNDDDGGETPSEQPVPITPRRIAVSHSSTSLPLWLQAAIRLGTKFVRVAAAGLPPGISTRLTHEKSSTQAALDMSCESCKCGVDHPPVVDEYYFWLVDARRFESEDAIQDADVGSVPPDPTSNWDRPSTLPLLLHWVSQPFIHLAWTRIHFGSFDPPQRSAEGINVTDAESSSLNFDGRQADSLLFTVSNAVGGFRYDLALDEAVTFPQVVSDEFPESVAPTPLSAYPYFIYFEPGAPLFPINSFATSLAIARSQRVNCKYEEALAWLRAIFDPLRRDNGWPERKLNPLSLDANQERASRDGNSHELNGITPSTIHSEVTAFPWASVPEGGFIRTEDSPCSRTAPVKVGAARARAVALEYVQTLMDWGDQLMCKGTRDSRQQASTLFQEAGRILGPQPLTIESQSRKTGEKMTLSRFRASVAALNPRLLDLYDKVEDRQGRILTCMGKDGLCVDNDGAGCSSCLISGSSGTSYGTDDCLSCCAPYRFTTLLSKAMEHTNAVKSQATALLSTLEKGDTEYLAALRTAHERQLLSLNLENKQASYRESDWSVQALEKQMQSAQTRLRYYQELLKHGLNQGETGYLSQTQLALASRTAASFVEGTSQAMNMIPDISLGGAGIAGSPLNINVLPIGTKMSMFLQAISRILNILADNASTNAGISSTVGGWDRRLEEWLHQVDVITLEIAQIKRQTLAAHRRRQMSLRDLNHHQRSMDHSGEIQDFMRDKLTKQYLYMYLQQETAALYRETYDLAVVSSKEALRAFRNERPDLAPTLHIEAWNDLHEGLMSGERLEHSLRTMEREYLSAHCREYELSKHFSLRLHFPLAFLQLKTQGWCEIDIPEWMYDLDYPGHYMRRIKNVTVTVPCVVGPYVGIHCKLQLQRSSIRTSPSLARPATCCCDASKSNSDCGPGETCYNDFHHLRRQYVGTSAIATSTGQNDSGLFELSFRDERVLPFEFGGAISTWRIEMPKENNQFDLGSLSDFVMHVNFSAKDGGERLKQQASKSALQRVPGNGVRFLDARHELANEWALAFGGTSRERRDERASWGRGGGRSGRGRGKGGVEFPVRLSRRMFPFLTGERTVDVTALHIFIELSSRRSKEHPTAHASHPFPTSNPDHIKLLWLPEGMAKCNETSFTCVREAPASTPCNAHAGDHEPLVRWEKDGKECKCAGHEGSKRAETWLYHGKVDLKTEPLEDDGVEEIGRLTFPEGLQGRVKMLWFLVGYRVCE